MNERKKMKFIIIIFVYAFLYNNVDNPLFTNLKVNPSRSTCVWSLVNSDGITASELITVGDQLLVMTRQGSTTSGSDQENLKPAWDVVRGKLLDFRNVVLDEQQRGKRPLSLYALSEGSKIRLLWDSLQQLEEEMKNNVGSSDTGNMDDWLIAFSRIIQNSFKPVCISWLKKELRLETDNMELVSLITEKLNEDDTVLQNITKSGKKNLYAESLYFLRFGSLRCHHHLAIGRVFMPAECYILSKDNLLSGCCYDQSLFTLYGDSILEDLVITLADWTASTYLELISIDGNLSDEVNGLGLAICNLSTRALQRLRNEVALYQWLYQNMEAIASMYEDRFALYTLKSQHIEEKSSDYAETYMLKKSESVPTSLQYVMISHFSMSVKRTKELRALKGWRYYFNMFLEFSETSLPMVKVVIDKVSNAISFFLVCLIGRSLGLIYTGIRQSLRWK